VGAVKLKRIGALTAVALVAAASGAGAAPASCVPSGINTLRASGAARTYSRAGVLYACLGRRQTRLGSLRGSVPFPARRVALYALSPRYAAVDTLEMGVDTLASTVALIDLRSGRTLERAPATSPERAAESFSTVTEMKVNGNGVLAWIGRRSAIGDPQPVYELHILAPRRAAGVSAHSTIALVDLALSEKQLSYRFAHDGRRVVIPLPLPH
jgi:hypothetical protein